MAEPQTRFDLIKELTAGVDAYKTAHPSAGIVAVTLTDASIVVGMTETVGNIQNDHQFKVAL